MGVPITSPSAPMAPRMAAVPPPAPNVAPQTHPLVAAAKNSPEQIINLSIAKVSAELKLMGRASVQIGNVDAARFFGEAIQALLKAQQSLNPNGPRGSERLPVGPTEPVPPPSMSAAPEGDQVPGSAR